MAREEETRLAFLSKHPEIEVAELLEKWKETLEQAQKHCDFLGDEADKTVVKESMADFGRQSRDYIRNTRAILARLRLIAGAAARMSEAEFKAAQRRAADKAVAHLDQMLAEELPNNVRQFPQKRLPKTDPVE